MTSRSLAQQRTPQTPSPPADLTRGPMEKHIPPATIQQKILLQMQQVVIVWFR